MLPIISGTVRSMGKLMQLDSKWQQKKAKGKIFAREMTAEERLLQHYKEQFESLKKSRDMNAISSKIISGELLTMEEMEYLKKNNPQLYKEYMDTRAEKEAYERELKECKTREEADRLKLNKMSGYLAEAKSITNNPNIPKGKKLALIQKILSRVNHIEDAHMKFIESGRYAALPTEAEAAEEAKEKAGEPAPQEETQEKEQEERAQEPASGEESQEPVPGKKAQEAESGEESQEREADYEKVKAELVDYLQRNRPSGYGLDYLADELDVKVRGRKH